MVNTLNKFVSLIFLSLFCGFWAVGQDVIVIDPSGNNLNRTIANQFSIYDAGPEEIEIHDFLENISSYQARKIESSFENVDFTAESYFFHFIIKNESDYTNFVLETARPITNEVELLNVSKNRTQKTGDEVPFNDRPLETIYSAIPISIPRGESQEFVMKIRSDGESLQIPIVIHSERDFAASTRNRQLKFGMYIGFFLFTILIYLAFYVLLKDALFLRYVIYVFFTGLLQATLEGYLYQFALPSGGFLTQHSVILVAGLAVCFALGYARNYLKLTGTLRKISSGFLVAVIITMAFSLIPGRPYLIAFPVINLLSFTAMIFLLISAFKLRKSQNVNLLFIFGLSSLVIGGLIFIFGNIGIIDYPEFTQPALRNGTLVEIICLSILMAAKYKELQAEKEEAQRQLVIQLEETNERLEFEVAERTKELNKQTVLLAKRNKDFIDSVTYAQRIQSAVLSNEEKFLSILPKSFVYLQPKDIVSGDFFWIDEFPPSEKWPEGLIVYATVDCTGHGVPGAFVSIIGNHLLDLTKANKDVQEPGQALDFLNKQINENLNSRYGKEKIRDGMDMTICALDRHRMELHFSGAKNSALIVRNGEIIELKGDRMAVGYDELETNHSFETRTVKLEKGDMIYTFTDGYQDQFGGPKGKKIMVRKLKNLLAEIAPSDVNSQKSVIESTFINWKGEEEQIDDVLLIGIRV